MLEEQRLQSCARGSTGVLRLIFVILVRAKFINLNCYRKTMIVQIICVLSAQTPLLRLIVWDERMRKKKG